MDGRENPLRTLSLKPASLPLLSLFVIHVSLWNLYFCTTGLLFGVHRNPVSLGWHGYVVFLPSFFLPPSLSFLLAPLPLSFSSFLYLLSVYYALDTLPGMFRALLIDKTRLEHRLVGSDGLSSGLGQEYSRPREQQVPRP